MFMLVLEDGCPPSLDVKAESGKSERSTANLTAKEKRPNPAFSREPNAQKLVLDVVVRVTNDKSEKTHHIWHCGA